MQHLIIFFANKTKVFKKYNNNNNTVIKIKVTILSSKLNQENDPQRRLHVTVERVLLLSSILQKRSRSFFASNRPRDQLDWKSSNDKKKINKLTLTHLELYIINFIDDLERRTEVVYLFVYSKTIKINNTPLKYTYIACPRCSRTTISTCDLFRFSAQSYEKTYIFLST